MDWDLVSRVMNERTLPESLPRNKVIVVTGTDEETRKEIISELGKKYNNNVVDGSNGYEHATNAEEEYCIALGQRGLSGAK